MLNNEDLKWIATTATELNAALQQISRYSDLARQHKGEYNYIELLGERVELASKTAQSIFDRVTSQILAASAPKAGDGAESPRPPAFTVVRPPPSPALEALASKSNPTPAPKSSSPKPEIVKAVEPKKGEIKKDEPSAFGELPNGKTIKNPNGKRELILLVEDEAQVAELAAEMLVEEGYKVILAKDGFEALKIYRQIGQGIGLVILDFFLPVIDGDAVFEELRALNPKIDVVLSSGFAEQSTLSNMLAQGLRGFIPKPYTREKLLAQVRTTLDAPRH